MPFTPEAVTAQARLLDELCFSVVSRSEIDRSEIAEKEAFRCRIEAISQEVVTRFETSQSPSKVFYPLSVQLKCFGSLSSGFATKASDMDLGLLSPMSSISPDAQGSQIPRLLEKAFLDAGLGARLLTRTRVPIIKLCENPPETLRQDLLSERFKWENGLDHDHHDEHEDDEHEFDVTHDQTHDQTYEGRTGAESKAAEPNPSSREDKEAHIKGLKQGPRSSLASYYNLAKRILRRAGGHDVKLSNFRDLLESDWEILDRVCHAFVDGLLDKKLRDRLARYPSLSFTPRYNTPANRALLGVYTQVEGEHIRQLWEESGVQERNHGQHMLTVQAFRTWEEIQFKQDFGIDPVFYTKELQLALDKIKRAPSVQFVTLEQGQHETPSSYYSRTVYIMNGLRSNSDNEVLPQEWQAMVIKRYLAGIHQDAIRVEMNAFIASYNQAPWLKVVARRHETIHLAWEFERALEKGLYDVSVTQDIKDYISLLRSPSQDDEGRISVTPEVLDLLIKIKDLPDPHNLAPNQPRDRYNDRLEFPKSGVGVQCDINFSAHLALHNTALLRCYSHTDPRVRPMILFIKHWAKVRGINSGYRGTLSSYGYVLMVLHYLVNVAEPFVSPNLQQLAPQPPPNLSPAEAEDTISCRGYNVKFWRNEEEILTLARANQLNHNTDSIGHLLRGFFEYYAQSGPLSTSSGKGFDWGRDVLSLRTPAGLLTKQIKGWTGAKTVRETQNTSSTPQAATEVTGLQAGGKGENGNDTIGAPTQPKQATPANKNSDFKEVRYRYLFAIEDPFELEHNVARTVTHNGIVSIRDEFRRAWRIIKGAGSRVPQEDLLQDLNDVSNTQETVSPFVRLLYDIHGLQQTRGG